MIDPRQLRDWVVRPALHLIGAWSLPAEQQVMGTAAKESRLVFLHQVGGGPALGLWQMEPETHDDIWSNFLRFRQGLREKVCGLVAAWPLGPEQLATNLAYGAAMCRIQYLRDPEALPKACDVPGMARTWKRVYNTPSGKGREEEFVASWGLVAGLYR